MPGSVWPQHQDSHDCHAEDRDAGALPWTRDAAHPANLAKEHGVAAVSPAVPALMRGQPTSDGARALPPPTQVVLRRACAD